MFIVWFSFFFFKQKTAYEMRISDWSSDVCSSDLLRPGGISLAFHPVYYALPFVINTVLPEHMKQKMQARVFPNRNVYDIPQFPANYSGCSISRHVRGTLADIGFSDVCLIPFYGTPHYGKFHVIREVPSTFSKDITPR